VPRSRNAPLPARRDDAYDGTMVISVLKQPRSTPSRQRRRLVVQ
jgi:hypothetical protein